MSLVPTFGQGDVGLHDAISTALMKTGPRVEMLAPLTFSV